MSEDLKQFLENNGYFSLKEISGRGVCGLHRFLFTVGLVHNLTKEGYGGRYCYKDPFQAALALNTWDGNGDPKDSYWIKYKGEVEYSNTNI